MTTTERGLGEHEVESKTVITHPSGIEIIQLVVNWSLGSHKVIWVRDDIHVMEVDGNPNMLSHADFRPGSTTGFEAAVRRVKKAFCEYWGISQDF